MAVGLDDSLPRSLLTNIQIIHRSYVSRRLVQRLRVVSTWETGVTGVATPSLLAFKTGTMTGNDLVTVPAGVAQRC